MHKNLFLYFFVHCISNRIFIISIGKQDGGSWSKLGIEAQQVDKKKHTMELNLNSCVGDHKKKYTILHEFGHVLGLVHEHQHPRYLEVMDKFLSDPGTMACWNMKKLSEFQRQFGSLNKRRLNFERNPDKDSIMHYP